MSVASWQDPEIMDSIVEDAGKLAEQRHAVKEYNLDQRSGRSLKRKRLLEDFVEGQGAFSIELNCLALTPRILTSATTERVNLK
ncbi:hypothetical protein ASD45_13095 [Pseudolabrys sp. Root1462]|nr:hypothetical protein ASD45_13095 [Pseudolabrys sp. Root1462]